MDKKIFLIAAVSDNGVIGIEKRLPWHFSIDLKKFKEVTSQNTVIMGRNTFESIGKALPNRENILLTSTPSKFENIPNLECASSLAEAIQKAEHEKVFIIGGESVYREALNKNLVSGIYLTQIHETYEGDAHFPKIPEFFKETGPREILSENPRIDFVYLENTGTTNIL